MKRTTLSVLAAILFAVNPFSVKSQSVPVQDSIALINFFDSTNGNNWTNHAFWRTSSPVTLWHGVLVKNGRVVQLTLDKNNISGPLPISLGNLTQLTNLTLSNNSLVDTMPASLGNLASLQIFDLSYNKLTGQIPSGLGNLIQLQTFNVSSNNLSGSIPASLGNLTRLKLFYANSSHLSGSIPDSIGNLTNLQVLSLNNNQLTGSIPLSFGRLVNVQSLNLGRNRLTGNIPDTIGNLRAHLRTFVLEMNQLSGRIPASVGSLTQIAVFQVDYNYLTGPLPTIKFLAPNIGVNRFNFDGLEQTYVLLGTYSPQATIPLTHIDNNLSVTAGGTLANDTFRLYKDNILVATQVGDSVFTITSTGKYSIHVRNSIATKLILYSDTLNITTLPLKLLSFNGEIKPGYNLLKWETTSEVNTDKFIIQRSTTAATFTDIGTLKANPFKSGTTYDYSFVDAAPAQGNNNYRLKMLDKDGVFTCSSTITIKANKNTPGLAVYPTLVKNSATVYFTATAGKYAIIVTAISGKIVKQLTGIATAGSNNVQLDVSAFSAGEYVITYHDANCNSSVKLVKE